MLTCSYRKIRPRLESMKKRRKYCNTGCHRMLRPKKPINNNALIVLFGLKKVEILWIVIVSPNRIIYGAAKYSSNMSY